MKNNNELELLQKKYKKLKKLNIIFIVIIAIGVLGLAAIPYAYTHKDKIGKSTIGQRMNYYRNKVNSNLNQNYEYTENNHNAPYKLNLNEGKTDIQATHPKVLNFKEKWNGYKYWLVFSPYPYGNDKYENPHLVASNDLINWEIPKGLKNPIEPTPKEYKHEVVYNSDPHILYNPDTNKMELYFRYVNEAKKEVIIYRKISSDGINWSDKEVILTEDFSKDDFMSPAFIYDNGTYKMWAVGKKLNVRYLESKDGVHYTNEKTIELKYPISGLNTWHLDVIKTDKGYEMITVAHKYHKDRNSMNLYYFKSKDNNEYERGIIILRPSLISWDNRGIYRSTFMYEDGTYYVFYAALDTNFVRGVGLSYGENIENLIGANVKES